MKEINEISLKSVSAGCGEHAQIVEVNAACRSIFELSTTESDQRLSPFWGLYLMSHHCTSDEIDALVAEYEQAHG